MSGLIPQAAALGAISPGEERPTQSELRGTLKGGPIQWLLVPFTFPPRADFGILWEYFRYRVWWWWIGARSDTGPAMRGKVLPIEKVFRL